MCACLGVGQGMVVAGEVISAGGGHSLELVIGKSMAEVPAGCGEGIIEDIVRIIHLIYPVRRFEATFVKTCVVCHQGITFQQRMNLLPNLREHRRILCVLRPQAMHLAAEPLVIFRLRVDEAIERIDDDITPDNDDAHTTNAARLLVRSLEIQAII